MTGGMMFKGTPGPWEVEEDGWIVGGGEINFYIVHFKNGQSGMSDCEKYDARLIAAAPELLEALHDCVLLLETLFSNPAPNGQIVRARAAIAKALGEKEC